MTSPLTTSPADDAADDATFAERAKELRDRHYQKITVLIDRLFIALLGGQWAFAVALALIVSPRSWEGASSQTHPHVWFALGLGGLLAVPPAILAWLQPGKLLTRCMMAIAQMAFGALLIHLTGGRIETHFHVFGSLAFLAFYRDYRVLLVATGVVLVDHIGRGVLSPETIYGVAAVEPLRWFEHAGWVVFEDVFLVGACVVGQRELGAMANRHARLELQSGLERGMAEAQEASRAKSEFLANMSHEIRTPMTAIIGYADLLLDPETTATDRLTHIQTVRRNGEHLLGILNDILDLSKIEAGKMTIEQVRCSPSMIIVDVASLMRVRAKEKGLFFEVHYQTPIPETIQSDPTRIRQILLNLVGNAIKFTASGGIRILARCENADGPSPTLTLEVVDTGIGLSGSQTEQLFQPFVQADTSTTRKFGGTGLGLAICRRLALILGGDISVDSSPGRGSSFRLTVAAGSLAGVKMFEELHEAGIPETGVVPADQAIEALSCNVLLAEDGLDNQLLISTHLTRAGARVTIAENGRIALEMALAAALAKEPFDVILMDMQMPEMDGYAATSELRRKGYTGPIVALTAHAMAGDRERCLAAGCSDYLTKPIGRSKLVNAVAEHAKGSAPRNVPLLSAAMPVATSIATPVAAPALAPNAPRFVVSELADDEEMTALVEHFTAGLPAQAKRLEDALDANDRETVRRLAHQLKGAAGGYGYPTITSAAARLEQQAREGETFTQALAEVGDLCRRARASSNAATTTTTTTESTTASTRAA
jgi:signal transduction histidine kinase/CheY-like chemotaxis protein/HPt (histidine-containing phosphotransfer) domain-containing protein